MTSEFMIGVHSLVYLNHKGETVSSEALAENVCTNPARIRKVMAKLKKAKLVETREGNGGGYYSVPGGANISLEDVATALSQDIVKPSWKSGSEDMDCLISSGMAKVMDDIFLELNSECLAYLKGVTIADIDRKIFK